MKKFKQILKKIKKVSTAKKALLSLTLLAIATSAAAFAVWGPNRPAFDYTDPVGRKGSLNGPVFNSMKNTPIYGDEFNFTTARKISDQTWSNDLKVVAGDQIEFRVLVHNNANSSTNESGLGIAKDVKAGIDLPQNQFGTANEPIGFVNASNSTPKEVFDSTRISTADGKRFKIDYIEGSAKLSTAGNKAGFPSGTTLSDNFVSKTGTTIGSNAINGVWPGCFEYYGWITIRATIIGEPQPEPNYTIKKYVNDQDAQDNASSVKIKPGEEFTYRVDVTNTGDTELKNVKAWDILPAGVSYVDNSLKLESATVGNDEDFFNPAKGVTIPSIAKGSKKSFTFKAVIKANTQAEKEEKCKPAGTFYNNVAKADPEGTLPEKQDPAVINCDYTPPKKEPAVDIKKTVSKNNLSVNEVFTYTLVVTNTGNIDLKNVKVDDPAPANIVFNTYQQLPDVIFEFNPYRVKATIAELKVGQSKTLSLTAKVVKYVPGQLTNTACVNAEEVNPQNTNQNDDCDSVPVTVVEPCPIPGKENMPKNSADCQNTPNEVPSTGAGTFTAGLALLVAVLAFVASHKMSSKKQAKSKN